MGRGVCLVRDHAVASDQAGWLEGRIGDQQAAVKFLQCEPGLDTQFLHEDPARVAVHGQGFSLAARSVHSEHQQTAHPLSERVLIQQDNEFCNDLVVPPQLKVDVKSQFQHIQAAFRQPSALGLGERAWQAGERDSVEKAESRIEQAVCLLQVAAGDRNAPRLCRLLFKDVQVKSHVGDSYGVSAAE
jgi:hypothetical protein